MKDNHFVIALFLAAVLAWVLPDLALFENGVPISIASRIGISLNFFFHGLKLGPEKIIAGLGNFRLHISIQLATFLLFPVLVLAFYPFIKTGIQETLWLAMFFLAALPSTVAASVVMVTVAKGNEPAAILNASISGLIGILITPIWMGIFLTAKYGNFDFSNILLRMIVEIVTPVLLGAILRPWLLKWTKKHLSRLSLLDKVVVLLIVYKSLSDSINKGLFAQVGGFNILIITVLVMILFIVVLVILYWVAKRVGFNENDRITFIFCGSMKSLIHGTVFSNVLFGSLTTAGIMLIPIMIYHSLQIFVISLIASRYSNRFA